MLIVGIIFASIAIGVCLTATICEIISKSVGGAILTFCLVVLNVFILVKDIDRYNAKKNCEYETEVVKNVVGYSVDTLTFINGQDTTKTYTLTYWKDYE